jgi:hypothetical protein
MIAANILNEQSRTANEGWSSSFGIGRGANGPHRKNVSYNNFFLEEPRSWTDILLRPKQRLDWIELARDRDRWRALVNAVINIRVP